MILKKKKFTCANSNTPADIEILILFQHWIAKFVSTMKSDTASMLKSTHCKAQREREERERL